GCSSTSCNSFKCLSEARARLATERNLNHPALASARPERVLMRVNVGRLACVAACLIWLAGCETTSTPNPFAQLSSDSSAATPPPEARAPPGSPDRPRGEQASNPAPPPQLTPELLGSDPNDDLAIGKKYYRQGSYGLAERHFRKAVELHPRDAESWVGLAAAYDQLRRFDLADRAYAQVLRLIGPTPDGMNSMSFS